MFPFPILDMYIYIWKTKKQLFLLAGWDNMTALIAKQEHNQPAQSRFKLAF